MARPLHKIHHGGIDHGYQNNAVSEREEYDLPSAQIGRYVLVDPAPSAKDGETFFEFLERMRELNERRGSDIEFVQGSIFLPLVTVDEFTDVVRKNHPKNESAGMRRTLHEFRSAIKQTRRVMEAVRREDGELVLQKFAVVQKLDPDDGYFDALPRFTDPGPYMNWGIRSVGLKSQTRQVDDYGLGFGIQPDVPFVTANEDVFHAIRMAGLKEGLRRARPQGLRPLVFAHTSRPFAEIPADELPVIEEPPRAILLDSIILEPVTVDSEQL